MTTFQTRTGRNRYQTQYYGLIKIMADIPNFEPPTTRTSYSQYKRQQPLASFLKHYIIT